MLRIIQLIGIVALISLVMIGQATAEVESGGPGISSRAGGIFGKRGEVGLGYSSFSPGAGIIGPCGIGGPVWISSFTPGGARMVGGPGLANNTSTVNSQRRLTGPSKPVDHNSTTSLHVRP